MRFISVILRYHIWIIIYLSISRFTEINFVTLSELSCSESCKSFSSQKSYVLNLLHSMISSLCPVEYWHRLIVDYEGLPI